MTGENDPNAATELCRRMNNDLPQDAAPIASPISSAVYRSF